MDKSSISYLRDVFDEGGWGGSETVGLFRAIRETLEASVWLSSFCLGLVGTYLLRGGGGCNHRGLGVLGINIGC